MSSYHRALTGERVWDGIQMAGPYSWRPPRYWFSGRYGAARGATAEQGDNEHIPPFASLKKFIPPDKLWPINDAWYFHAGSNPGNAALTSIRLAVDRRYGRRGAPRSSRARPAGALRIDPGPVRGVRRRRLGRPQDDHLLDAQQPLAVVLRTHLRLLPAARRGLLRRQEGPAAVVGRLRLLRDGRPRPAKITVVNHSPDAKQGLRARVRVYDLQGRVRDDASHHLSVASGGAVQAMTLPRVAGFEGFLRPVRTVRPGRQRVAENVYWQSQQSDDVGDPRNDWAFELKQSSWADMTALNHMGRRRWRSAPGGCPTGRQPRRRRLHNPTSRSRSSNAQR